MRTRKEKLKIYRELLLLCKRVQIINKIDNEIENRIPSVKIQKKSDNKQKVLTLYPN